MKFRSLDKNSDWNLGQGINSYVQDNDAIALDIKTAVLSWVRDCFFAENDYIDWHTFLDKGQEENLQAALVSVISQRQGVVYVTTLDYNLEDRDFHADYDVVTIYSQSLKGTI